MFESFCESISTSVEHKIYTRIGLNAISPIQAESLIKHGYLLGGWYILFAIIGPLGAITLAYIFSIPTGRIDNNLKLIRDSDMLSEYYSKYKLRYNACKEECEFRELFTKIEQDLFNYSMDIINNTGQFGG